MRPMNKATPRTTKPRMSFRRGMFSGQQILNALDLLVPALAILLIVLSVLGTFYGARTKDMPLLNPVQILADIAADPMFFVGAIILQTVLSVFQWGGRQNVMRAMTKDEEAEFARLERAGDEDGIAGFEQRQQKRRVRWAVLYLGSLFVSVYWNIEAYWYALTQEIHIPFVLAFIMILGADILAEVSLVAESKQAAEEL